MRILITGAGGYIGRPTLEEFLSQLGADGSDVEYIIAVDRVGVTPNPGIINRPNTEWVSVNLDEVSAEWWNNLVIGNNIDRIYYIETYENTNTCAPQFAEANQYQLSDFYFISFLQSRLITEVTPDIEVVYLSTDKIYYGDDFPNENHDILLKVMVEDSEPVPFLREDRRYFYSYAAQKAQTEVKLQNLDGVNLRIIRPFAITGPGISQKCPIPPIITDALTNQDIQIHLGGSQGVAFTHVNDLVTLFIHPNLFNPDIEKELSTNIINFCRVQNYLSVRQLVEKIINKTESTSSLILVSGINVFSEVMQTPQIRNMFKIYQPQIPIEMILDEMIYNLNPENHYIDISVSESIVSDIDITMSGEAEPNSTLVIWFANGEVANCDVDKDGDWNVKYEFVYPIDIYPIEIIATSVDGIQFDSEIITV